MFFADNLKKTIYVCYHDYTPDGVITYAEPVEYQVSCHNVLPTSASANLTAIGTSYSEVLQVVGDPEYLRKIQPLDRVYVEVSPPMTHDKLARGADFFVKSTVGSPMVCRIMLKQLTVDRPPLVPDELLYG